MNRDFILGTMVAGFGLGIFFRSFFEISPAFSVLIAITGIFILILPFGNKKAFSLIGLFFVMASIGAFRYDIKDSNLSSELFLSLAGKEVVLGGYVGGEPDKRIDKTFIIFRTEKIQTEGVWSEIPETGIRITAERYPQFEYGDILRVSGKLREPQNFSDFDYKEYLAKDDIFFVMNRPEVSKTGTKPGTALRRFIFSVKSRYLDGLNNSLPEPNSSFLGAVTVGARRALPESVSDAFRRSGLIHIVVLSGFHVTVIAAFLAGVFGYIFPRFLSLILGIFGVVAFVFLAGASATVVRAGLMASILYLAGISGRIYDAKRALLIAGFLMVFSNPKIIRFDMSFQLSFLATLGILYLFPYFRKKFGFLPERLFVRDVSALAVSAQIAVSPLILYQMGTFSLVSIPANILAVVAVPYAMLAGALTGVAGMISPHASYLFSWAAFVLSEYIISVGVFLAGLPFSQLTIEKFPAVLMVIMYVLIFVFVLYVRKKQTAQNTTNIPF